MRYIMYEEIVYYVEEVWMGIKILLPGLAVGELLLGVPHIRWTLAWPRKFVKNIRKWRIDRILKKENKSSKDMKFIGKIRKKQGEEMVDEISKILSAFCSSHNMLLPKNQKERTRLEMEMYTSRWNILMDYYHKDNPNDAPPLDSVDLKDWSE